MKYIKKVSENYIGETPIATEINSSSTNDEVAGAKAVYDNSLDVYSTTEQRIGTWINGKPLYRKIIQAPVPTVTTSGQGTTSSTNINVANIEKLFVEFAYVYNPTDSGYYVVPVFRGQNLAVRLVLTNTILYVWNYDTLHNGAECYVSLLYTKTTD